VNSSPEFVDSNVSPEHELSSVDSTSMPATVWRVVSVVSTKGMFQWVSVVATKAALIVIAAAYC